MEDGLNVAASVGSDKDASAKPWPMEDRIRQVHLAILDSAIESPLLVKAKLFALTELRLVFFLMFQTQFLNNLEHLIADRFVLIVEARDQIGEQLTLMILFVWQARKQVANRLVEALAYGHTSISNEARKVVELGRPLIEILDRHNVGIAEANHHRDNLMRVLELATEHHIVQAPETCHSHLGMLVHEGVEQRPAHHFTEMDQLLVATDGKLLQALAALDDDSAGGVHAESAEDVDNLLRIRPHAVEDRRGDHDRDDFRND